MGLNEQSPVGLPGGVSPIPGMGQNQQNPTQIMALLRMIMQARQRGAQGPTGTPQQGGSLPGQLPQMGSGAPMGQMPQPVGTPVRGGYEPPPNSSEMMSKLDPTGGAVYSAMQGVQQLLQNHFQRKDQKEHVEAANIAQNLMTAMANNDTATVHEILNDPKSTKVLNKVYTGWLQKSEESQQPPEKQEPPDPVVSGFEKGIAQGAQKTQQQKKQKQQQPQYKMPQAGPAQLLAQQKQQNEMREAQAQGSLSKTELEDAARIKAGIVPTQAQQTEIEKTRLEMQAQLQKNVDEIKKSQLEAQKAQLTVQEEQLKKGAISDQAQANLLIKKTELLTAQARLALVRLGPKGSASPQVQARLNGATQALSVIDNIIGGKGDKQQNSLTNLKRALSVAGLNDMAKSINEGTATTLWRATGNDSLKQIRETVAAYQKALQIKGQTPDVPDDSSTDVKVDSDSVGDNPY